VFDGRVLENQSTFARDCVKAILQLYQRANPKSDSNSNAGKPKRLIVLGHSMGGVVARGLFLDAQAEVPGGRAFMVADKIDAIITLNTPHRHVSFYLSLTFFLLLFIHFICVFVYFRLV
jgi:triacylglycerol esterase/lipase EstA (alpha/beta hydrolase family)